MDASILEDIGLTNAQIKVYLALLGLGQTTSGPIIQKSDLPNSVVYNALHQLIEQDLVSFISKGRRKYFAAANPQKLITIIENKKSKVEKLIPELIAKQTLQPEQNAQVFLGWKGAYQAFTYLIDNMPQNLECIAFAIDFEEKYRKKAKKFFEEFQKKSAISNFKMKVIANEEDKGEVRKTGFCHKSKSELRFVPGYAPQGLIIFGNNVLSAAFGEQPVVTITTSNMIAESYRKFFYNMWKIAKK